LKNRILFVGNFFDQKAGTITPSRKVGHVFEENGFEVRFASTYLSRVLRIPDILARVTLSDYDFLHLDVYSGNAFRIAETSAAIALKRNKPYILTLHGGLLPEFYLGNEARIRKIFAGAQFITTPSRYLHGFFKEIESDIFIHYIPNMVDLSAFTPKETYSSIKKLLWVRAFTTIYNPEISIRMLHILKETHPELTLTMVGPDKGQLSEAKGLAEELGLSKKVYFTGPVQNNELPAIYREHDLYLNTTSYESFGMSVMEAGASGLPIVSSKVGELPLIWQNGRNILFANELNPEAFAHAVKSLLNNTLLANSLGMAAVDNVSEFDKERIASQWAAAIHRSKDFSPSRI
jgi:glycosyltransferase involved in cell wall biosynthesis